ncbi:hypothetical protein EJA00_10520 [Streptococcus suis]|uniref:Uncharacterized protein n=1 Tax=Streptococcus suis TaxID=1307 RepID=A0A426T1Z4_STRSU|nr:hypothetical protein EJA00_10520 [Streptococcus suis]
MRLSNSALKSTVICSPFQYRHLVYLLLLRRARKHRFLISNFKHSTGVFELTLPDFVKVTCFASIISHLTQSIDCVSSLGDCFKSMPRNKKALSYACGC